MDLPPRDAVKNIPLIILGIWPATLLTLWARGHEWAWDKTPQEIIGLWEWGFLVSLSLVILIELGVEMFIALGKYRRRMEQARDEGRKEAQKEARRETGEMLMVLNAAARANPDLLPSLLQEYQEKYQNGTASSAE